MDEHRKMEINSDTTTTTKAGTTPTTISTPPPPTHNKGRNFEENEFNSAETKIIAGLKFRRGREGGTEGGMAQLSTAPMHVGAGDDAVSQADVEITTGCYRHRIQGGPTELNSAN